MRLKHGARWFEGAPPRDPAPSDPAFQIKKRRYVLSRLFPRDRRHRLLRPARRTPLDQEPATQTVESTQHRHHLRPGGL